MTNKELARRPGRPRDASIDARVLKATRELLAEQGYDETTVQAISARSEMQPSAIYRRWPSRVEIIEQAVSPDFTGLSVAPTGDPRRDLRRFVGVFFDTWGEPAARAAMPGLLATYQSSGRSGAPADWLPVSARPRFCDIVRAAPPDLVDPTVDLDDVFDYLLGAMMAWILVPTVASRSRPADRLVDMTLRLLRP